MSVRFPKAAIVYPRCVLATLFDALYVAFTGTGSRSWSARTYLYDGQDGNFAAIAFRGESFVAAVFDHESERSPWARGGKVEVDRYFTGLPDSHRPLVEECLYFKTEWHDGTLMPLITTAFWDEGAYICASESWEEVWKHGANVLEVELTEEFETAFLRLANCYGFGPVELDLARALFERRMMNPPGPVYLEPREFQHLETGEQSPREAANPQALELMSKMRSMLPICRGKSRPDFLDDARRSLAAIEIYWPKATGHLKRRADTR